MMAIGGTVRGGLYGTAAKLTADPRQPDAREQRRRRALRDRLPIGLREGDRLVAGRGLRAGSSAGTSGAERRTFSRCSSRQLHELQHAKASSKCSGLKDSLVRPSGSLRNALELGCRLEVSRSVPENPSERNIQLRIAEVIPELLRVRGDDALAGDDVVGELAERELQREGGRRHERGALQ